MSDTLYPPSSRELAEKRRALAPETEKTFQAFSRQVFAIVRCLQRPSN